MSEYSWDWKPKSKTDAQKWRELDGSHSIENVIRSEFADETIIKEMAKHNWSENQYPQNLLPTLLQFPGINEELVNWLDEVSTNWPTAAQHNYWYARYVAGLDNNSFPLSMLSEIYGVEQANIATLKIAGYLTEQLWHDLVEQGQTELYYSNGYRGDDVLEPSNIPGLSEDIMKLFVVAYDVNWLEKTETLDFEWARDRAEEEDGKMHFEDGGYTWDLSTEVPFPDNNLGYAIGAGVEDEELEVIDEKTYARYLASCYTDSEDQEVTVTIKSDTPWDGPRYRDLNESQQLNLVTNLVTAFKHPYLGRADGITVHLLKCMAKHNKTADNVKAFILLNLPS